MTTSCGDFKRMIFTFYIYLLDNHQEHQEAAEEDNLVVDTPVEAQLLIEDKALTLEQAVEDKQRIEGMQCR